MQASENTSKQAKGLPREIYGDLTKNNSISVTNDQAKISERKTLHRSGRWNSLYRWLVGTIVQDVPEDSAICEFDCKKGQCTAGEWAQCDRRHTKAAGELWPAAGDLASEHTLAGKESKTGITTAKVETQ